MPTTANPKIIAHCVVRNEEIWVWYAVQSVLDVVDEVWVWDTGSTDHTREVIATIVHPKLKFKSMGITADETALSSVRQKMLDQSSGFDWLMILDGDEVWLDASIRQVREFINREGNSYESIVVPTLNCVGDIYHVSPQSLGRYRLAGRVGHLNTRFINLKIPGLRVHNEPNRLQGYLDDNGNEIHQRNSDKIKFLDAPYLHMTHLTRSRNRSNETSVFWRADKKKYEIGDALPSDFAYPRCFYYPRPQLVPQPWKERDWLYMAIAVIQWPLKTVKRTLFHE